ncbi:hypothetical protein [Polyangium sp. 6x1]|uniref:hypothetical protein n=1 Tax=Polyangium sp. 6x1 TaxID=3042689 RepID=UPI002482AF2B|nr:hypothetical protein [Polyangium sp. 6x1]MDI1446799.1 hypothetical protein [Polyangium sp. 6x1]
MLKSTLLSARFLLPFVGLTALFAACGDSSETPNEPGDASSSSSGSGGSGGSGGTGGEGGVKPPTPPGPDAEWGTGSEVGSLEGGVWTPGHDENGLVNADSWALVPSGQWIEVNGTRLDALDAEVKEKVPGWNDYGSGDWNAVTIAWNAPAFDPEGSRAWWVASGGHADSSNNGIYRFDAFRMAYSIEHLPSDTTLWSDAYKSASTFSSCPESSAAYDAAVAAGTLQEENDWFYDEVFWDRQPTARHTYSGVVYVPKTNELVMAVRRLWRYSRDEGKWVYKRLPALEWQNKLGEESLAVYDEYKDQLLVASCGSNGPWSNTFDMNTSNWTGEGTSWNGWDWNGAADARFGDQVAIFKVPEDPATGQYAAKGLYQLFDVKERKVVKSGTVQYADGLSAVDFPVGDSAGMVYIPPLDRYWVAARTKEGKLGWFELNPTTEPWTLRPLVHDGTLPTLDGSTLVRRRILWMPKLDALVFLGSGTKNIMVYRF